ncbi:MAG TPA: NAD-binding protein [Blastocatellia bacterium]|nr:NAD-binding protein [Blastocatellia bacterium]
MSITDSPQIVIFGATHIGIRLANRLAGRFSVVVIDQSAGPPEGPSGWRYEQGDLTTPAYVQGARVVFAVTDEDKLNIRIALAVRHACKTVPVVITLVQSRLGRKLARHLEGVSFISPPELAAQNIVEAIYAPKPVSSVGVVHQSGDVESEPAPKWRIDRLIVRSLAVILTMMLLATIYFHNAEALSWIDAFYFVVTMMATVGFGDISLRTSTTLSKVIGILLMIASVTNTAVIFALVSDSLLRRRLALTFGRRRVRLSGHILVVGVGSVGLQVIQDLIKRGERVVAVDKQAEGKYLPALHALGIPAVIGDATYDRALRDAGMLSAKAMVSVTSDDLTNLEIGLNARLLKPDVRVVLRIYDPELAQSLDEHLDIHFAFSMSSIAAGALAQFADKGA